MRAAAAQLGVPESTAYYWLRGDGRQTPLVEPAPRQQRARETAKRPPPAPAAPAFARAVRASDGAAPLTLRVGDVALEVRPGFDAALLREVIAALLEVAS